MARSGRRIGACATTPGYGAGGYGAPGGSTYPGGTYGDPYGNSYGSQRFIATVQDMDPRGGRMMLAVDDGRGYSAQRVEVYFDGNTRLYYRGQLYPVSGLERGDQVSVDAVQSGGRLWARLWLAPEPWPDRPPCLALTRAHPQ